LLCENRVVETAFHTEKATDGNYTPKRRRCHFFPHHKRRSGVGMGERAALCGAGGGESRCVAGAGGGAVLVWRDGSGVSRLPALCGQAGPGGSACDSPPVPGVGGEVAERLVVSADRPGAAQQRPGALVRG